MVVVGANQCIELQTTLRLMVALLADAVVGNDLIAAIDVAAVATNLVAEIGFGTSAGH